MTFNKKEYDKEYKKKYKKQFKVDLNIEEYEKIDKFLKEHNITKVKFVKDSYARLKKEKE